MSSPASSCATEIRAKSFGIVALCGDELAGWCTSEYNSGDRCEVGIGTLEPHQHRGVATALGSAFVERARAQGYSHIGWHCWADNLPSSATALKNGNRHLQRGEYALALAWYRRAIERGIAHKWTCWAAARASTDDAESAAEKDGLRIV